MSDLELLHNQEEIINEDNELVISEESAEIISDILSENDKAQSVEEIEEIKDKLYSYDSEHKVYCRCGQYGAVFYNTGRDRLICKNCGNYIYKDKKTAFKQLFYLITSFIEFIILILLLIY